MNEIRRALALILEEATDGLTSADSLEAYGHLQNIQEIVKEKNFINDVIPLEVQCPR